MCRIYKLGFAFRPAVLYSWFALDAILNGTDGDGVEIYIMGSMDH
jgi:hypothetical protein